MHLSVGGVSNAGKHNYMNVHYKALAANSNIYKYIINNMKQFQCNRNQSNTLGR